MKKRWLAAITAVVLLVSATGCTGGKQEAENGGQTKSFTYWCRMQADIASKYQTMGEMAMYQKREEDTGIHIEFIHPTIGQENEQFNLMIASRELPDMVEWAWQYYTGGAEKAIDDNIIIKLNDLMDANTPNFKKAMENQDYDRQSKTDTGIYFGFPALNVGPYRTFGGILIRKDLLDKADLEVPVTIDEWETVLRTFKDMGIEYPFTGDSNMFAMGYVNTFNNAFHVGKTLYINNDVVKYGPIEPAYQEWIALMNRWYEEGLLDKDYATNGAAAVNAKMIDGTAGACFGYIGGHLGTYLASNENSDYNLVGAPYPSATKGELASFAALEPDANDPFLAITTACKDPEAATQWADFWYSDEGVDMINFGVKGESYNMVDGKHVYTDEILHNPDGLSIREALSLYCRATDAAPGFRQDQEYLEQYYPYQQQMDALNLWAESTDNVRKHTMPAVSPLLEESSEISILETDISTYVSENVVKFVQGTRPMSEFDDFVSTLKSMGVDRYIEIYQAAYDRYLNK